MQMDQLASESILVTRVHTIAPLYSQSRGSPFIGRYPYTQ